jgi:hypothetical protein
VEGPYRYYAVTLQVIPASHWPEPALRLPERERVEDFIGERDGAREITRDDYYSRPALSRYTRTRHIRTTT